MGCEIGQITNENATRPFVECAICWVTDLIPERKEKEMGNVGWGTGKSLKRGAARVGGRGSVIEEVTHIF